MASMLVTPNPDPVRGPLRKIGFTLFWIDVVLMLVVLVKAIFY